MSKTKKVKQVLVYLGDDQHEYLRKLADTRYTTVSGVLRQIINDYLKGGVKS